MDFSVIVPTLNEEDYIEECLISISKQTYPREKYEIIVSDGSSKDKTTEIAKKYADNVVISEARGIWWGRNYGAKFANGKYLVFIDADTLIDEDYLEFVYNYLENGVIGLTVGFNIDRKKPKRKMLEHMRNSYWWFRSRIGYTHLIGINLCVPKSVFIKIGGFKEYALEDVAIDKELRKEGLTLFLAQRKVVTSARRHEAYGMIGLCRYYIELGLIDSGIIKNQRILKHIKYRKYMPTHMPSIFK